MIEGQSSDGDLFVQYFDGSLKKMVAQNQLRQMRTGEVRGGRQTFAVL